MIKIEYIAVEKLKLHPDNPRQIKEEQFKILCKSLQDNKDYFETRPVLCNKDMVVFAGNMRLRAAIEIGMKEVPTVIMDISEERQKEIMIRDNRQNGEWNWEILANVWSEDDLLNWGFSKGELGMSENPKDEIDTDNLGNTLDSYLDGNIRQIVLYFKKEEYEEILPRLEKIIQKEKVESHTEAFLKMLENYERTYPE